MNQLQIGMLFAVAVDDLGFLLEFLAPDAVEPLVYSGVKVVRAPLGDSLDERNGCTVMSGLGSADPVVVRTEQAAPGRVEPLGKGTDPLRSRNPRALRGLSDLLGIFVHPHDEVDVVTPKPPIPGNAVGPDFLQGVPEMGLAVGIVDGGCEVELRHSGLGRWGTASRAAGIAPTAPTATPTRRVNTVCVPVAAGRRIPVARCGTDRLNWRHRGRWVGDWGSLTCAGVGNCKQLDGAIHLLTQLHQRDDAGAVLLTPEKDPLTEDVDCDDLLDPQ